MSQSNIDDWYRHTLLDYSPMMFQRMAGFAVRRPEQEDSIYTLLSPFDLPTWQETIDEGIIGRAYTVFQSFLAPG